MTYPIELRGRVLLNYNFNTSTRKVGKMFGISHSIVHKWVNDTLNDKHGKYKKIF